MIENGAKFAWYFHYMPVGADADTELLLTPEQREHVYRTIRQNRKHIKMSAECLALALSIEGSEEVNDSRRGEGVYQKTLNAMKLLKKHKCLFGTSVCYTSKN